MSDEGRAYVKEHSPFTGTTFWLHYVLGDLANQQNGYEIWIGDKRLAEEWPISVRAIQRGRAQLVEAGYLTLIDERSAPGRPIRYRFEFLNARQSGGCSDGNARQPVVERPPTSRQRPPMAAGTPITNQKNQTGTEASCAKPAAMAPPDPDQVPSDPLLGFDQFWAAYPMRGGRRRGRGLCETRWKKLTLTERRAAYRGAVHYGIERPDGAEISAADPDRWLRDRRWEDYQDAVVAPKAKAKDPLRRGGPSLDELRARAEAADRSSQPALGA